ncbi:S-adenosylmethionine decarboxylase proenzyme isoform X2 [Bacillus rossius redtenbacheri]|uniref:S-adenosylmethionine decarboxylase proenzyme isoform X2 n=1 Tax=Bacillus rossius redtenbacheri TaxID=93214 RepID=UPI002FDD809E
MSFCGFHHSHFRVAYCGLRMAEPEGKGDGQYFEGVEKLLEIWFKKTDGDSSQCDLRNIPRHKLENMLKIVRCEVISFMQNDEVDAYVLSESSMFVAERRLILKTCGTTTPLQCLKALLVLVKQHAGFNEVEDVYYSRKNFKRPDLQMNPHKSFEQEVLILNSIFQDGTAYCFGSKDQDCWYLYTLNPLAGDEEQQQKEEEEDEEADQTLEILMSELDPEVMSIFTRDESSSAAEATRKSGIEKLIPDMVIDDYLFEPCGYSMNGITKSGHYMTIHITPEPDFSYVSFETNVPQNSYKELIDKVLKTFQPRKFVVTVFANKCAWLVKHQ